MPVLAAQTSTIPILGCAPTPLAHYLKALGILRLVAEQADPETRGWWIEDRFFVQSRLNADALTEFFLELYAPTPLVAPWNAGGGFYAKNNQQASSALAALRHSRAPRFAIYRRAIETCFAILDRLALGEKPDEDTKIHLLRTLRNEADDVVVQWIDAAAILTGAGTRYPPLLGTGGNDGRLEFTANFMQQLGRLFDLDSGAPLPGAARWLAAALWRVPTSGLVDAAIGQFFPGAAGGPNASTGFEGHAVVNPWDFVLMLEGALLFSAASHRRLTPGSREALAAPFTVQVVEAGNSALAPQEQEARAEMWMPLWDQPTGLDELRVVLREGRAHVGRRSVRNGLDFARACASLAVDRGIREFQRYGFFQRSGRSYLATPLTRFPVRRRVEVDLLNEIDGWLMRTQAAAAHRSAPASLVRAVHRVQAAAFDLTRLGGAAAVQELLAALAGVEWLASRSPGLREVVPPVPRLSESWIDQADDGSPTFRLGLGLASLIHPVAGSFRTHWSAVEATPFGPVRWAQGEPPNRFWHEGPLTDNLVDLLVTRFLAVRRESVPVKPTEGTAPVSCQDVAEWMVHPTWDDQVEQLAMGCSLVSNLRRETKPPSDPLSFTSPLSRAYAALALVLAPDRVLQRALRLAPDVAVPVPGRLFGLLRAERIEEATAIALRRLKASGLPVGVVQIPTWGVDPRRIVAALAFPISIRDAEALWRLLGGQALRSTESR